MMCRKTLDPTNLAGSFSTTAAVKLFENKRRETLVRADGAHDLATMTVLMPVARELGVAIDDFGEIAAKLLAKEKAAREIQFEAYNKAVALMHSSSPPAVGAMREVRKELSAALSGVKKYTSGVFTPALVHVNNLYARVLNMRITGVDDVSAASATLRYMKCCAALCEGVFNADAGACLVCDAPHCKECYELAGEDHTCQPGARATARFVLANTKSCPRCHANIQRASGCAQMMCTCCNCIFSWTTGKEERGVVHNPHFFNLSEEARTRVAADRVARGLVAPPQQQGTLLCVEEEFDPMCIEFDDQRMYSAVAAAYAGVFPVTCGAVSVTYPFFRNLFRNVLHVETVVIDQLESCLRNKFGERAARGMRLARLMGCGLREIRHVSVAHPDGGTSQQWTVFQHASPPSSAQYAAQLMRIDTERSKVLAKLEIQRTYVETMKDLFRTAILVPPSERIETVKRIVEFAAHRDSMLADVDTRKRKAATGNQAGKKSKGGEAAQPVAVA
jgi:hypothetical protein